MNICMHMNTGIIMLPQGISRALIDGLPLPERGAGTCAPGL